jgi:hypothetical protein
MDMYYATELMYFKYEHNALHCTECITMPNALCKYACNIYVYI